MTNTTKTEASSQEHREACEVFPGEVRKTLSVILQSPPFRSSLQIQKVLQFLVLETLAGRGETLKERNIGASLFERAPGYDTNSDPIVRLRVAEVRKRLALFYQGARDETVLINIPSGSFKAVFERSGKHPVPADPLREPEAMRSPIDPINPPAEKATLPHNESPSARFRLGKWWIMIAAVLAVAFSRRASLSSVRRTASFKQVLVAHPGELEHGIDWNRQ